VIVGDARGRAFYFFHQTVEIIARGRDADNADRGAVPELGRIEFGDRNVEARAQAVFQAPDDLASIFNRLRGFDVKFEGEKSDGHEVKVASGQWVANHRPPATDD
jgi:hypothetical protein